MNKIICSIFFTLLIPVCLTAQILPKEGAKLHYRIIGFTAPEKQWAKEYKIEVANGNYKNDADFSKNIVVQVSGTTNKIVAEVPGFGNDYTWRMVFKGSGSNVQKGELHHFATIMIPELDTNNYRLRIIKQAAKYKDAYVFLDDQKALYDMAGKPVWYLPHNSSFSESATPRDFKLSPLHTITFNSEDRGIFEINYNGDILWTGPDYADANAENNEHYHHQFSRLANGNYMVLGTETVSVDMNADSRHSKKNEKNAEKVIEGGTGLPAVKAPFGTVIEYNAKGKIVWKWRSWDYFKNSDLKYYKDDQGLPVYDIRENSFYFDEKESVVYISFRVISRVLKVSYPDGKVVGVYGEIFKEGVAENGNGIFCGQHSCNITMDGNLYLFNNNSCGNGPYPSLVVMHLPATNEDSLYKIWDYAFPATVYDNLNLPYLPFRPGKGKHSVGGNIAELPGKELFASMSSPYGSLFIVNMDKQLLWCAEAEKWNAQERKWQSAAQYRASIISGRAELEQLIWNIELDK